MSLGEQWRSVMLYRQMSKWKEWGEKEQIRLDLEAARTEARTEGKAEGMAEGMEKSTLEIVRKMKEAGDSAERIHTITGLSLEAIERM
jgi:predicted transposase YdaD